MKRVLPKSDSKFIEKFAQLLQPNQTYYYQLNPYRLLLLSRQLDLTLNIEMLVIPEACLTLPVLIKGEFVGNKETKENFVSLKDQKGYQRMVTGATYMV